MAVVGSPRAMQSAEYPVNVPTSTADFALTSRVSIVMNAPCSGEICMIEMPPSAAVFSISACWTASGSVPCSTR